MKTLLSALTAGAIGLGLFAGCGGSTEPEGTGGAGGGVGAEEGPRTIEDLEEGELVRVLYVGDIWTAERFGDSLLALDLDVSAGRILDDDEVVGEDELQGAFYRSQPWGSPGQGIGAIGTVPWVLSGTWSVAEQAALQKARDDISAAAPGIRFRPKVDADEYFMQFLVSSVNSSPVGPNKGGNLVRVTSGTLTSGSFSTHHEIMHSLGIFHEQSRDDRNKWIEVHWGGIEGCPTTATSLEDCPVKTIAHNFARKPNAVEVGDYDLTSVMQYPTGYSNTGGPTDFCPRPPCITQLVPSNPSIGQRFMLSPGDRNLLNAMYPEPGSIEMTISRYIPEGVNTPMCKLEGAADGMIFAAWQLFGTLRSFISTEGVVVGHTWAPDFWSFVPLPEVGKTYTGECVAFDYMWLGLQFQYRSGLHNVTVVPQTPMCPPYCDPGLMSAIVTVAVL